MNVLAKMKSVTLAVAVAATSFVAMVPDSYAHACNGKGAITIRPGKTYANGAREYWYIQGGAVCGRFVT